MYIYMDGGPKHDDAMLCKRFPLLLVFDALKRLVSDGFPHKYEVKWSFGVFFVISENILIWFKIIIKHWVGSTRRKYIHLLTMVCFLGDKLLFEPIFVILTCIPANKFQCNVYHIAYFSENKHFEKYSTKWRPIFLDLNVIKVKSMISIHKLCIFKASLFPHAELYNADIAEFVNNECIDIRFWGSFLLDVLIIQFSWNIMLLFMLSRWKILSTGANYNQCMNVQRYTCDLVMLISIFCSDGVGGIKLIIQDTNGHIVLNGMQNNWKQIVQKSILLVQIFLGNYPDSKVHGAIMGPTWGPPGSCRPQMGPMMAPWTLLSG